MYMWLGALLYLVFDPVAGSVPAEVELRPQLESQ